MSMTNECIALPYVYKLTHRATGEFYIGYREANVLPAEVDLPAYGTSSKYVAKLGMQNFTWEIIAVFYHGRDAYDFEQELIRVHRQDPLIINRHFLTADSKRLRYIRPKGSYTASAETRAKLSASLRGRCFSAETRAKLSASLRGRCFSAEHRLNIGKSSFGRQHTLAVKAKISEKLTGINRVFSDEWKANIRAASNRRNRSEETKKGAACVIDGRKFISVSEAARALGWSRSKVRAHVTR